MFLCRKGEGSLKQVWNIRDSLGKEWNFATIIRCSETVLLFYVENIRNYSTSKRRKFQNSYGSIE
jgi:hypothetical protein